MLAQTGLRKGTVEAMDLDDIFFDETKGKWCLRVPAHRFKNGKSGPYFGTGFGRRHHYERDLLDSYGLYDAIDHYLKTGRGLILGEGRTRALFVVHPVERTGVREQQYSWCEKGRMTTQYLGRLVHGVTGKYLRHDPETGAGIPGITSFPGHDIRHIIATGVLKQAVNDPSPTADPWHLAADAIHDGVRTVMAYVQYLPRDRQDKLLALLDRGLIDG
jgi:integrase